MVIIGAKGLAKELLAVLFWNDEKGNIYLFDNVNMDAPDLLYEKFPIIKSWEELEKHFKSWSPNFLLGVGGAKARKFCSEKATSIGGKLTTLVSRNALVGGYGVEIGQGVSILPHAILTSDVKIGQGTLINKAAIVSHDASVGSYCDISPGVRILGTAVIGDLTEIGANAIILPGITVGSNCRVGAGTVVTKDVPTGITVIGVPAKPVVA